MLNASAVRWTTRISISSALHTQLMVARNPRLHSYADEVHVALRHKMPLVDLMDIQAVLAKPQFIIVEWMPTGPNHVAHMCETLGAFDRTTKQLFSAVHDHSPLELHFETPKDISRINVIDYKVGRHINFEVELLGGDKSGIGQLECLAVHMAADGLMCFGCVFDAIAKKTPAAMPLDMIARVTADVQGGSSGLFVLPPPPPSCPSRSCPPPLPLSPALAHTLFC